MLEVDFQLMHLVMLLFQKVRWKLIILIIGDILATKEEEVRNVYQKNTNHKARILLAEQVKNLSGLLIGAYGIK